MRHTIDLRGRQVYLAGPRTWVDPAVWAPVEASLLDLGLIDASAASSFRLVARALRIEGAHVFSPMEHDADSRAGRAADAAALAHADLVVVLDGWEYVAGAVDAARLVAATRGVAWAEASEILRAAARHAAAA
ncbi:MAG: hypothetical protein ACT4QF_20190 [Sporichthyaceae bacterium]|jgi:hypothetical protein